MSVSWYCIGQKQYAFFLLSMATCFTVYNKMLKMSSIFMIAHISLNSRLSWISFTREFWVKTGQCYSKSLQCTHWIPVIHCKDIFGYSTELHYHVFRISVMYNLEIFHRSLSNATMKIQHVWLCIVIPNRGLVM